jgi:hypothetical protein
MLRERFSRRPSAFEGLDRFALGARSARISACAAARSEGSESKVFVTLEENHDRADL